MKTNKPTRDFWMVLGAVNTFVMMYPFTLLHRAEGTDANLFATVVLIGCVFLLGVVDTVSIIVANVVGSGKR